MKSPVKIVFLDFDGVLNSSASLSTSAHQTWIAAQDEPPTGFVILDDAELEPDELGELQACFVRVDAAVGPRDEDVEAALRILDGRVTTRSDVERGGR